MPCPIPHQPKPPTRSPLYYRFPELAVYHGFWIHSIYEPAKDMMGELPNASLPQSYHGDRITPEQASSFSSPSAHPTPTPASFKHLFGGCAYPVVVPLNGTVLFFLAGSRLANTIPPPAKQRPPLALVVALRSRQNRPIRPIGNNQRITDQAKHRTALNHDPLKGGTGEAARWPLRLLVLRL